VEAVRRAARRLYGLLRATYENWRDDRAIRLGAALAYYGAFAAVPLVASAVAVAGLVFSQAEIEAFLIDSLDALVADASDEVRELVATLASTIDHPSTSGGLAVISAVSGVFAASLLFVALQDSLNMIWDLPVRRGIRFSIRRRLIAFGTVLLTGAVLVVSITVQAIALLVDQIFGGVIQVLNLDDLLVTAGTWASGLGGLTLLYKTLIRVDVAWRNAVLAAGVTIAFIAVGTWAAGLYFDRIGAVSLSGVSGGALVLLTWFYFLAQTFIGGAELLKTLEQRAQPSGGA
jgi:membrane protein